MKAFQVLVLAALVALVAIPFAGAQAISWSGSFTVVNLGLDDAHVRAIFYDEDGNDYTPDPLVPGTPPIDNPFTLAAGGSQMIVMAFTNVALPDGHLYALVLDADQPIVAIANLSGFQDPNIDYNGSYSGSGDIGQAIAYLPSVSNAFYNWYSHLSIQNLTNAAMDVTVRFYWGTTTEIGHITKNVPPYTSWRLEMDDPGLSSALPIMYNGSATVEAAGPVAVINNDYNQGQLPGAEQTYSGFTAGSTDLYCPGLYDLFAGVWISSLNVQNIGTSDANVTIYYSDSQSEAQVIAPNASWLGIYMSGSHATTFSAHVTSDQPVVAVANANAGGSSQTYECATAGSTQLYTPLALKWFIGQYNTSIQVQNVGANPTDICIMYEGYAPSDCEVGIAPNGVVIFYTPDGPMDGNWSGSARVYSTSDPPEPLVGIVNQNNDYPGGAAGDFALSFLMFAVGP